MNIFELGVFAVNCTAGYFLGKTLSIKIGIVGWLVGFPAGFLIGAVFFLGLAYFGGKLHERKTTQQVLNKKKLETK